MRFFPVFLAFALAGCASIPMSTMYNLWNFDPWQSDFRTWRAAARIPQVGAEAIKPRIVMKIETWRDGQKTRTEDVFVLQPTDDPADVNPLAKERRAGTSLTAYRIDPNDHARLGALRSRVLASRKAADGLHGSLAITAAACGQVETAPKGKFPVSTFLLVDRVDGYNPMIVDYDLGEVLRSPEARKEMASACSHAEKAAAPSPPAPLPHPSPGAKAPADTFPLNALRASVGRTMLFQISQPHHQRGTR
jgi:hypothetical protein